MAQHSHDPVQIGRKPRLACLHLSCIISRHPSHIKTIT